MEFVIGTKFDHMECSNISKYGIYILIHPDGGLLRPSERWNDALWPSFWPLSMTSH